jgi:hypothetical protein
MPAVIQMVKVGGVDVTKDMAVRDIVAALGYTYVKNFKGSFSKKISEAEASALVAELNKHEDKDEDPLESLISDLEDIEAESDDEADGKEEKGKQESKGQSDDEDGDDEEESLEASFKTPEQREMDRLVKKHHFSPADANKIIVGQDLQKLFADWGGKTIYLSGGGAISLFAQHRAINDLDFRIEAAQLGGDTSWYDEPEEADGDWEPSENLEALNDKTGQNFENVPRGVKPNATNSRTAGVTNYKRSGAEVSITIVGSARETVKDQKTGLTRLLKDELLSDKLKTIISRNKSGDEYVKKVSQDIYDALVVYKSNYEDDEEADTEVLKDHLSDRANEYRQSNTEEGEDKEFVKEMGVESLVARMFNRLVLTIREILDSEEELQALVKGKGDLGAILDSIAEHEVLPLWDGWYKVVKEKGKTKHVKVIDDPAAVTEMIRIRISGGI